MAITINGSGTIGGVSVGGLPDGIVDTDMLASGAITDALLPSGSVLQVVQTLTNSTVSTSSSSYVDSGISASITPSSSSNKILIAFSGQLYSTGNGRSCCVTIFRGSVASGTNLNTSTFGMIRHFANNDEIVTYKNQYDLLSKLSDIKNSDKQLIKRSKNAKKSYFNFFENTIVTESLIHKLFETSKKHKYVWIK